MLAAMYGYDGWSNVGTIAGEMKNPKKRFTTSNFIWFTSNNCNLSTYQRSIFTY